MKYLVNLFLIISVAVAINSCTKVKYNYPGGTPSEIFSIMDIRSLYKGIDVRLSTDNMRGASKLGGVVISDHKEKNLPKGLLVVQDNRRLKTLRGISIDVGDEAANYHPGDSLVIDVIGGMLTRKDGILTITGLTAANLTPAGKGVVAINSVTTSQLLAHPDDYESSLCIINKCSFNPAPKPGDVISGAKVINDGFSDFVLYTDPAVSYAQQAPYGLAAYVGIPFGTADGPLQLRTRDADDIINMGSSAQDLLITGFQSDPKGGDGGYEYVQMMATKDIDFSVTPYSIVFCANAGGNSSATVLDAGWATGGQRTIKYDITTGTAHKGKFFYFLFQGKKINGSAGVNPFPAGIDYIQKTFLTSGKNAVTGSSNPNLGDGGLVHPSEFSTSGPFANSGNTCGLALFEGTTVTETSVPEDVLFVASGGGTTIYDVNKKPNILGYRICNNDWYSMFSVSIDTNTYKPTIVPYLYYQSLGNSQYMPYPYINGKYPSGKAADAGLFNMMGGVYNIKLGRWTTARQQVVVELFQATATIDDIEKDSSVTQLVE